MELFSIRIQRTFQLVSTEKDLRGDEGTVRQLFAAREEALRPLPPARKDELDGRGGRVREIRHQQADIADLP